MVSQEVVEGLNHILTDSFEIESYLLRPEAQLREDLDLDSLDGVDLVVAIEKRFGCRIKETEARKMGTLNDIYEFIQKCLDGTS